MYSLPNIHIAGSRDLSSSTAKKAIARPPRKERKQPPLAFTNSNFGKYYAKHPNFERAAEAEAFINGKRAARLGYKVGTRFRSEPPEVGDIPIIFDFYHTLTDRQPTPDSTSIIETHLPKGVKENKRRSVKLNTSTLHRSASISSVRELDDWFMPLGKPSYLDHRPPQHEMVQKRTDGIERSPFGWLLIHDSVKSEPEVIEDLVPIPTLHDYELVTKTRRRRSSWGGQSIGSWSSAGSDDSVSTEDEIAQMNDVLDQLLEY